MPQLQVQVVSDDGSTTHYSGSVDLSEVPDSVDIDALAHFTESKSTTISGN